MHEQLSHKIEAARERFAAAVDALTDAVAIDDGWVPHSEWVQIARLMTEAQRRVSALSMLLKQGVATRRKGTRPSGGISPDDNALLE